MLAFDLQLFGGKGSSSTTVQQTQYPNPTQQELAMQDLQLKYAELLAPNALKLNEMGSEMLFNNPGVVPVDYTKFANDGVNQAYYLQNQAAGLYNAAGALNNNINAISDQNNLNQLQGQQAFGNLSNQSSGLYGSLMNNQSALNQSNASSMQGLMNGQLNSAAEKAQQDYINRGVQSSVGSALSSLAGRGVINSSVMDKAMQGINDSVATEMSKNYSNNLAQQAALQNQNATQQQSGLSSLANLGQQNYSNQAANTAGSIGLAQQGLDNQSNILGQQSNLINQQSGLLEQNRGLLTMPMEIANAAQNASIDITSKLYALSLGQQAPTTDAWKTMSNQRYATPTTTSTQNTSGGGGLFGGILSGLASNSGLFCFVDKTQIRTPDGDRKISDIDVGDEIICPDVDGNETVETVTEILTPQYADVYAVVTNKGMIVECTRSQPFLTAKGEFKTLERLWIGDELKGAGIINSIVYSGERKVYDLKLTGKNNYFADGFIVKGGSDEW